MKRAIWPDLPPTLVIFDHALSIIRMTSPRILKIFTSDQIARLCDKRDFSIFSRFTKAVPKVVKMFKFERNDELALLIHSAEAFIISNS